MPRKKNNTLGSSYGPMEGVEAAHKGHPRAQGATIRQHGLHAPARTKREKPHTYSVREGAAIIADKVNSFFASEKKPAKKKKK